MRSSHLGMVVVLVVPLWVGDLAPIAAQPLPNVVPPAVAPRPRVKPRPARVAPVPRPPVVTPKPPRPAVPKRLPKP